MFSSLHIISQQHYISLKNDMTSVNNNVFLPLILIDSRTVTVHKVLLWVSTLFSWVKLVMPMSLRRQLCCTPGPGSLCPLLRCPCRPSSPSPGKGLCTPSSPSQSEGFWSSRRSFLSRSAVLLRNTPRTSSRTDRRPRRE